VLLALAFAGCGGSGGSGDDGPDPATLAPADTAVYGEALVRPDGKVATDALAAARKVLRIADPVAELQRLIDGDTSDRSNLTYADDIEPWLGQRVGFAVLPPLDSGDPEVVVAAASRDTDALAKEPQRLVDAGQAREAGSYKGVTYYEGVDESGTIGIVDDFLVLGTTLQAFRAAVDASKDSNLADASRFQDATDEIADDALASFYADPKQFADALRSLPGSPQQTQAALARLADADPVTASLTADADEIALEATGGGSDLVRSAGTDGAGEVTVDQLPGDAWLALATPPLGPLVRQALTSADVTDEAAAQVRQATGFDLERDLLGPLGGLGVFVRGSNPLDIGGGALLQMGSAAAAQRLVTRVQAIVSSAGVGGTRSLELSGASGFELQIPGSPQPVVVLAKDDQVAAGYAASSAQDLLDPQQTFADSKAGQAAIDTLGDDFTPSFVLLAPPVTGLLRSLDELEVADLSDVLPYLGAYRSLAIGTERDDDRLTVRVVAALR
jgi:hypothetical protein